MTICRQGCRSRRGLRSRGQPHIACVSIGALNCVRLRQIWPKTQIAVPGSVPAREKQQCGACETRREFALIPAEIGCDRSMPLMTTPPAGDSRDFMKGRSAGWKLGGISSPGAPRPRGKGSIIATVHSLLSSGPAIRTRRSTGHKRVRIAVPTRGKENGLSQ